MSEKKLSALEKLKLSAQSKMKQEDEKLNVGETINHSLNNQGEEEKKQELPIFQTKLKQETKTISIDSETKTMINELKENGLPINNSALFRQAVKQIYETFKKQK